MLFSIIILAAGQSTRMQSSTTKLLHKIASFSIIDWILVTVKNLPVNDCIVVIGSNMKTLQTHIKNKNNNIKFVFQKKVLVFLCFENFF